MSPLTTLPPDDEDNQLTTVPPRVTVARPTQRAEDVFDFQRQGFDPTRLTTPGARAAFAPQIRDAERAKEISRRNAVADEAQAARETVAAQKLAERERVQAEKDAADLAKRDANAERERIFRQRGIAHYTDAHGMIVPDRHEDGALKYSVGEDGWRTIEEGDTPETGAYRVRMDARGKTSVEDRNQYAVFDDEPTVVYRGGPKASRKKGDRTGWTRLGTLDDAADGPEGMQAAAERGKTLVRDRLKKAAVGAAEREALAGDLRMSQWQEQRNARKAELDGIRRNIDQLSAVAEEKEGGFFGIGKSFTANAEEARRQIGELQAQEMELASALGPENDRAAMEADPEAAALRTTVDRRRSEAKAFADLVDMTGDVDKAAEEFRRMAGADDTHPVLAALAAEKEALGLTTKGFTPGDRAKTIAQWEQSDDPRMQDIARRTRELDAAVAAQSGTGATGEGAQARLSADIQARYDALAAEAGKVAEAKQKEADAAMREQQARRVDSLKKEAAAAAWAAKAGSMDAYGIENITDVTTALGSAVKTLPYLAGRLGLPFDTDGAQALNERASELFRSGVPVSEAAGRARAELEQEAANESFGGDVEALRAWTQHVQGDDPNQLWWTSAATGEFRLRDGVLTDPDQRAALMRSAAAGTVEGIVPGTAEGQTKLAQLSEAVANAEAAQKAEALELAKKTDSFRTWLGKNKQPEESEQAAFDRYLEDAGAWDWIKAHGKALAGGGWNLLKSVYGGAKLKFGDLIGADPEKQAKALEDLVSGSGPSTGDVRFSGIWADTIGQQVPLWLAAALLSRVPVAGRTASRAMMLASGISFGLAEASSNYLRVYNANVIRDEAGNAVPGSAEEAHRQAMGTFTSSVAGGFLEFLPVERMFAKIPGPKRLALMQKLASDVLGETAQEVAQNEISNIITGVASTKAVAAERMSLTDAAGMAAGVAAFSVPATLGRRRQAMKFLAGNAAQFDAQRQALDALNEKWGDYTQRVAPTPSAVQLGAVSPTDPLFSKAMREITAAREQFDKLRADGGDFDAQIAAAQRLAEVSQRHRPVLEETAQRLDVSEKLNAVAAEIDDLTPERLADLINGADPNAANALLSASLSERGTPATPANRGPAAASAYAIEDQTARLSRLNQSPVGAKLLNRQLAQQRVVVTPEYHGRVLNVLRGLVKSSLGRSELMTKAEETALGLALDGTTAKERVYDFEGQQVITEEARQNLLRLVPSARELFPQSEAERKAQIIEQKRAAEAEKNAPEPTAEAAAEPDVPVLNDAQELAVTDLSGWLAGKMGVDAAQATALAGEYVTQTPHMAKYQKAGSFARGKAEIVNFATERGWVRDAETNKLTPPAKTNTAAPVAGQGGGVDGSGTAAGTGSHAPAGIAAKGKQKPDKRKGKGKTAPAPEEDEIPGLPATPQQVTAGKITKAMDALGVDPETRKRVVYSMTTGESGMELDINRGEVVVDLNKIGRQLEQIDARQHDARLQPQLEEEIMHSHQIAAARRLWVQERQPNEDFVPWLQRHYGAMWEEFPADLQAAIRGLRDTEDEAPWQLAMEGVRMIVQQRASGRVTEATRLLTTAAKKDGKLRQWLSMLLESLRRIATEVGTALSARVQKEVFALEKLLKPTAGSTPKATGDVRRMNDGRIILVSTNPMTGRREMSEIDEETAAAIEERQAAEKAQAAAAEAPPLADNDVRANDAATSPTNDAPEPTPAQKEAGNYRLGHMKVGGLDISVENPAGSVRKGTDKGGKAWEITMRAHYGYILSMRVPRQRLEKPRSAAPNLSRNGVERLSAIKSRPNFGKIVDKLAAGIAEANASASQSFPQGGRADSDLPTDGFSGQSVADEIRNLLDVPFGFGQSSSGQAAFDEALRDALRADAKFFGNDRNAQTIRSKGYDALDIEGKAMVQDSVSTILKNREVFDTIIQFVPIDVMDMLVAAQNNAVGRLENVANPADTAAVNFNDSVRGFEPRIIDELARALPLAFALRVAEKMPSAGDSLGGTEKNGSAVITRDRGHDGDSNIVRPVGKDGDKLDVFVAKNVPETWAGPVYVVDQIDPATGKFDEHKVVIGPKDAAGAQRLYRSHYTKGWKGFGALTEMTWDEFRSWVKDGDLTKPAAKPAEMPAAQQEKPATEAKPAAKKPLSKRAQLREEVYKLAAEQDAKNAAREAAAAKPAVPLTPAEKAVEDAIAKVKANSQPGTLLSARLEADQMAAPTVELTAALAEMGRALYAAGYTTPARFAERALASFGVGNIGPRTFQIAWTFSPGGADNKPVRWDRVVAAVEAKMRKEGAPPAPAQEEPAPQTSGEIPKEMADAIDHNVFTFLWENFSEPEIIGIALSWPEGKAEVAKLRREQLISPAGSFAGNWVTDPETQEKRWRSPGRDAFEFRFVKNGLHYKLEEQTTTAVARKLKIGEPLRPARANLTRAVATSPQAKAAGDIYGELDAGREVTWQKLFALTDKAWGGTQAEGAYTVKDAYDALELAVNEWIKRDGITVNATVGAAEILIERLKRELMAKIPTQTKRTEESDRMQQFSTPPPFAYVANWVAGVKSTDVMLEPSAGIGGIAVFAKGVGARVIVNELSPRRREFLKEMRFDWMLGENAEHLHGILEPRIASGQMPRPTVVVMNPPFSNAAKSGVRKDTMIGAKHIEEALQVLAPGGRLVAIVGEGMAVDAPTFRGWWAKLARLGFTPKANILVDGKNYAKYGTTFSNRLLVIDKVSPPDGWTSASIKQDSVADVSELPILLEDIRNDRPSLQSASEPSAATRRGDALVTPGVEAGAAVEPAGAAAEPVAGEPASRGDRRRGSRGGGRATAVGTGTGTDGTGAAPDAVGSDGGDVAAGRAPDTGSAAAPAEPDVAALDVARREEPRTALDSEDDIFARYKPAKVLIAGSKPHPAPLVETAAMASVEAPDPTYSPRLPQDAIERGMPSEVQLEAVVYAGQAHSQTLPNGERRGFFIGDGTGVGKGIEIASIILDNWNQGRKKAVWISKTPKLVAAAQRDAKDVGMNPTSVFPLAKVKAGDAVTVPEGVLFAGYATLSQGHQGVDENGNLLKGKKASRLEQIVNWFGRDYDGVIVFDEAHMAGNAVAVRGSRGMTKPSAAGLAVVDLQKLLPKARIVYVSATGATELTNLSYADRLGMWGPGTSFSSKLEFFNKMAVAGLSGMEIVARDMKALGSYMARSISYKGVGFRRLTHELTEPQRAIYDKMAQAWNLVFQNMQTVLDATGAGNNANARSAASSAFWGAHQRFFNQFLISLQIPSLVKDIERTLADGKSAVLQLVNTSEAQQKRAIADRLNETEGEEANLDDLNVSPRSIVLQFVELAFPIVKYEEVADPSNPDQTTWQPVRDADGNPVIDPEAVAARDSLLAELSLLAVPDSAMNQIIDHFGPEAVAEVTGRSQRLVWETVDGKRKRTIQTRGPSHAQVEAEEFQEGRRRILIFSDAGGTGFSFHADVRAKNQQQRMHYVVQPGWRANAAMQGLGRSHRSNQATAPEFVLVETNIKGHRRFISTIARRLAQLGALTTGERAATGQGLFNESDNLESEYAVNALAGLMKEVFKGNVPGWSIQSLGQALGLAYERTNQRTGEVEVYNKLVDSTGALNLGNLPTIPQFLNRLLGMPLTEQNDLFDRFDEALRNTIEAAKASGIYDPGTQSYGAGKRDFIALRVTDEKVVYEHPSTAARTKLVTTEVESQVNLRSWEALQLSAAGSAIVGYVQNLRSERVYAVKDGPEMTDAESGEVLRTYRLLGSRNEMVRPRRDVNADKFRTMTPAAAEALWTKEYTEAPKTEKTTEHFLVGALVPIWDRLGMSRMKVYRFAPENGPSQLGVLVPEQDVDTLLIRLGAGNAITPAKAFDAVLSDGATLELANGWKVLRVRISNAPRIEVRGLGYQNRQEFIDFMGGMEERIQWETRYFLPTDRTAGLASMEKLLGKSPVATFNGEPVGGSGTTLASARLDRGEAEGQAGGMSSSTGSAQPDGSATPGGLTEAEVRILAAADAERARLAADAEDSFAKDIASLRSLVTVETDEESGTLFVSLRPRRYDPFSPRSFSFYEDGDSWQMTDPEGGNSTFRGTRDDAIAHATQDLVSHAASTDKADIAIGAMERTVTDNLPEGVTLDEIQGAQTGSGYYYFSAGEASYKVRIGDHRSSVFRQKEFGFNDYEIQVPKKATPSDWARAYGAMHRWLLQKAAGPLEKPNAADLAAGGVGGIKAKLTGPRSVNPERAGTSPQSPAAVNENSPALRSARLEPSRLDRREAGGQAGGMSSSTGSAQQDADYLAAVERGDMETAQRMVDDAARAAGYDIKAWHGSPDARFLKTDPVFRQKFRKTNVQWFAKDFRTARTYADERRAFDYQNSAPATVQMFLKLSNPLRVDGKGQTWRNAQQRGKTSNVIEEAQSNGNDGVIISNVQDDYQTDVGRPTPPTTTYATFSSEQIKSADPVTRDASGEVIPLSQRFNPVSDSILYSARLEPALNEAAVSAAKWLGAAARKGVESVRLTDVVQRMSGSVEAPGVMAQALRLVQKELAPKTLVPREAAARILEARTALAWQARMGEDLSKVLREGGSAQFSHFTVPVEATDKTVMKQMSEYFRGMIPLGDLPEAVRGFAEGVANLWTERGRAMVEAGIMSEDTFASRRGQYFPHMFVKHEEERQGARWLGNRLRMGLERVQPQLSSAWYVYEVDPDTGKPKLDSYGTPKLLNHNGREWRFTSAQHRDEWFARFVRQQIVDRMKARYPQVPISVEELTRMKFQDDQHRALVTAFEREIRARYRPGKPMTEEELMKNGLITDLAYVVPKSLAQMDHDVTLAKLFRDISANPAWVSDVDTAGYTQVPKEPHYGKLAGKWVQDAIYQEIRELREAPEVAWQIYDAALSKWKLWKTVYNPGTHVRNVLGNFFFADLAGAGLTTPGNWKHYWTALRMLAGKPTEAGVTVKELYENGVLGGDYTAAELQRHLSTLRLEVADFDRSPLEHALSKPWALVKKGLTGMQKAYALEDEVFKTAAFLAARERGMGATEAAAHVRKWFPFYDQVGKSSTIRAVKRLTSPFLSFMQEAFRIGGHALREKPVTFAKWLSIPALISLVSRAALGMDDDDWEAVKRDMRGQVAGYPVFSALMPWLDDEGRPAQWDFSNIIPYADMLGKRVDRPDEPPAWTTMLQKYFLSGPATQLAIAWGLGFDPFSLEPFKQPDMTSGEVLAEQGKYTGALLAPPLTPGVGTSDPLRIFAEERRSGRFLQKRNRGQQVARAVFGVDVRNALPNLYEAADAYRVANGMPAAEAFNITNAKSRARAAVYEALVNEDVPALTDALRELRTRTGETLTDAQDVNRLFYLRDPAMVFRNPSDREKWLRQLAPIERQTYDDARRRFQQLKAKAPALIRRAQVIAPELRTVPRSAGPAAAAATTTPVRRLVSIPA